MILHGFFRSTASWRVRIALALKGLRAEQVSVRLREGEQRTPAYLALNPQGLAPTLITDDGAALSQSLAICEYLDEIAPNPPLLPGDALQRARIRSAAQVIACDIHPVQNLKVLERIKALGHEQAVATAWARDTIDEGLAALDVILSDQAGPFAFGAQPTLADIFLIPQLGNARRFKVQLRWPRLAAIEAACDALAPFRAARPENQPDAE